MANKPDINTLREAETVRQALIAYMVDENVDSLHISPAAAGRVLLAPDDYDIIVTRDRNGIHVELTVSGTDDGIQGTPVREAYRPPVSQLPGFGSPEAVNDMIDRLADAQ